MFGITPLGWLHTLGSLPAIPAAIYMFARYGRIMPRSRVGTLYFVSMLIGALSVLLVAHQPESYGIAVATLLFLLAGYAIGRTRPPAGILRYLETGLLSVTAFLLMVPTVSETLRRVPDGHPLVTDLKSPLLLGAQGALLVMLVLGLVAQYVHFRRSAGAAQRS